jgi:hypothetical protein
VFGSTDDLISWFKLNFDSRAWTSNVCAIKALIKPYIRSNPLIARFLKPYKNSALLRALIYKLLQPIDITIFHVYLIPMLLSVSHYFLSSLSIKIKSDCKLN